MSTGSIHNQMRARGIVCLHIGVLNDGRYQVSASDDRLSWTVEIDKSLDEATNRAVSRFKVKTPLLASPPPARTRERPAVVIPTRTRTR